VRIWFLYESELSLVEIGDEHGIEAHFIFYRPLEPISVRNHLGYHSVVHVRRNERTEAVEKELKRGA